MVSGPANLGRTAAGSLLGIEQLTTPGIEALLAQASEFKAKLDERPTGEVRRGTVMVNLFFEPSTRTRVSFELAARRLGIEVVNWTPHGSSHEKGESLLDTANNVAVMGPGALVVRHSSSGAAAYLAERIRCPVVNAGDGLHEHPSQALLDSLTLRDRLGTLAGRDIAIVGDIVHSRVARSDVFCLTRLGAKVRLCGPPGLLPTDAGALGPAGTVSVHTRLEEALSGVSAVIALRVQRERLDGIGLPSSRDYARAYGLDAARLQRLAPEAVLLHPGPVNWGVELAPDPAFGARSAILEQVRTGVAVRMAILQRALGQS